MTTAASSLENASRLYEQGRQQLASISGLEQFAGHSVCVVGCTGQIGSILIETLQQVNDTTLLSNPIQLYGLARNVPPRAISGVTFLPVSVSDSVAVSALPNFDYILYVAGTASDYLRRRQETIETQVVGLEAFLTRFAGCKGFVYISSTRVYGRESDGSPITEQALACIPPMHTDNVYDSAKRLGESLCLWHARSGNTPVTVARLSNIYGAQDSQRSETAISDIARQAASTGSIAMHSNPDSTRNWTCVLDIAQGIVKTLLRGRPGDAYNIGSAEHLSSRQIAEIIAATFSTPPSVTFPPDSAPLSLQNISIEKAVRELGYRPDFTFRTLAPLVIEKSLRNYHAQKAS
jgi:UDP-glucuronate decarboxylase